MVFHNVELLGKNTSLANKIKGIFSIKQIKLLEVLLKVYISPLKPFNNTPVKLTPLANPKRQYINILKL